MNLSEYYSKMILKNIILEHEIEQACEKAKYIYMKKNIGINEIYFIKVGKKRYSINNGMLIVRILSQYHDKIKEWKME